MNIDLLPREKLLKHGPKTLSDRELLAVFLNTGTQQKSVFVIADELLTYYPSLGALLNASPVELCNTRIMSTLFVGASVRATCNQDLLCVKRILTDLLKASTKGNFCLFITDATIARDTLRRVVLRNLDASAGIPARNC